MGEVEGREMTREMRLKLDRRIHNQRVALRDNWMIVERRQRSKASWDRMFYRDTMQLLDELEIPRGPADSSGTYSIFHRLRLAREKLGIPPRSPLQLALR